MLGGAFGTLLRYLLSVLALPISRELPWGTIFINIAGSFVIGLFGTLTLASAATRRLKSPILRYGRLLRRLHHFFRVQLANP